MSFKYFAVEVSFVDVDLTSLCNLVEMKLSNIFRHIFQARRILASNIQVNENYKHKMNIEQASLHKI